jgi:hypothetical protein
MKPSAEAVLAYLRRRGCYVTSTEIIKDCFTTTPSKRLDELHDAGLIEKRNTGNGSQKEYRALSMPEILMRRAS